MKDQAEESEHDHIVENEKNKLAVSDIAVTTF